MSAAQFSRRNWIASGLMTAACICVPSTSFAAATPPLWLNSLTEKLAAITTWMRAGVDSSGNILIHCGIKDLNAWTSRAGGLAGSGKQVRAHGNTLSFQLHEKEIHIVLHAETAWPVTVSSDFPISPNA